MQPLSIKQILNSLAENNVPFCVWKNLHERKKIIAGTTDVDIHVPLGAKYEFFRICGKNGGIEVNSPLSTFPGVSHVLFPGKNNQVLHIHVYFEIFTGESHLKGYLLPISKAIISTRKADPELVYTVSPDMARFIYVIRHFLKKSGLVSSLLHWRERKTYYEELLALGGRKKFPSDVQFITEQYFTSLDSRVDKAGFLETWVRGLLLRRKIHSLKRIPPFRAVILSPILMFRRILNKWTRNEKKKLRTYGRFIAVTGLDGAGKSSLISELALIYSKKFTVHKVHLGRPPLTLLTLPIRGMLYIRRHLARHTNIETPGSRKLDERVGYLAAIRYVALAYERNKLSKKILMWISRGHIVFSDRYPSKTYGKMDSPQIDGTKGTQILKWLSKVEAQKYATILTPDLLVEVFVPYETARARNAARDKLEKETDAELHIRHVQNIGLNYSAKQYFRFNNNMTLNEAKSQLFNLTWPS